MGHKEHEESTDEEQTNEEKASNLASAAHWNDSQGKWRTEPCREVNVYTHSQCGTEGERKVKLNGEWQTRPVPKSTKQTNWTKNQRNFAKAGGRAALQGIGVAAEKSFLRNEIGKAAVAHKAESETPDIAKHVDEIPGLKLKVLAVDAGASTGSRTAAASACPVGANAMACASGAEANASAALIEGVVEAQARAVAGEAQASAGVGLSCLGAFAGASVSGAKAEVGVSNVPFAQAGVSVIGAGAETGISWKYSGASAGAHLAEARAGPLAVRAGVKFGAGIRNGVPEMDLGPVTVPCSIM